MRFFGKTHIDFVKRRRSAFVVSALIIAAGLVSLAIKGGLLGDKIISADEVTSLAELPPREILLAQVLGTIQGPAGGISRAIAGSIRSTLYVLKARVEQLEEQASQT